jgi:glutamine amidotransferase
MIAIIDYGLGNLTSIKNMHNRIGIEAKITSDHSQISNADKLILPGVGHYKLGMDNLRNSGLQTLLNELVLVQKKPILGICLGAQLMTNGSEEGNIEGLKWIDAKTVQFDPTKIGTLKIPHMGWSEITITGESPLLKDLPNEPRFYHVHKYHFKFENKEFVAAYANYGYDFPTSFQCDNIFGTQFHPEKSHKFGMKIIKNFSRL